MIRPTKGVYKVDIKGTVYYITKGQGECRDCFLFTMQEGFTCAELPCSSAFNFIQVDPLHESLLKVKEQTNE